MHPMLLIFGVFLLLLPWVGLVLLLFFLFLFLLLLPLGFAANSFFWLVAGPRRIFRVLTNRAVRRNHALEHATVNVLEERFGPLNISGLAFDDGFSLRGGVLDPAVVIEAAQQALRRLRDGEVHLALHRKCGTTIIVTNTLASLLFLTLLVLSGHVTFLSIVLLLFLAQLIGPVAGMFVQKYMTTAVDVERLEISGIEIRGNRVAHSMRIRFVLPEELFVATRQRGNVREPEILF